MGGWGGYSNVLGEGVTFTPPPSPVSEVGSWSGFEPGAASDDRDITIVLLHLTLYLSLLSHMHLYQGFYVLATSAYDHMLNLSSDFLALIVTGAMLLNLLPFSLTFWVELWTTVDMATKRRSQYENS